MHLRVLDRSGAVAQRARVRGGPYLFALAASALSLAAVFVLRGRMQGAYLFPVFLAVVAAGLRGGYGPALLAVAFVESTSAIAVFHLHHPELVDAPDLVRWFGHALTAIAVALVSGQARAARLRERTALEATAAALESERRARLTAEAARAEADDARRREERLVAIVGHDVRTPLGAIGLAARLLERSESSHVQSLAGRIRESADHIGNIAARLLDFATIRERGGIPVAPVPVTLEALCAKAVDELRAAHPDREVEVHAMSACAVSVDPDRFQQVVSNLVSNALQHGRGGAVGVEVRCDERTVTLSVHNQGKPIPPELLPELFEPFRRGQGGDSGNLGLGLYIVREIVKAHGGTVSVTSTEAEGTWFRVRLPRGTPAPLEPARAS
jgi:signal transduction histidine kinase